jgi:O-antigen ligase
MELGTGTLVFLVAVALVLIVACIRKPRMGIPLAILLFIPAPLWPGLDGGVLFNGFCAFFMLVLMGWLFKAELGIRPFQGHPASDKIASWLKLWLLLCVLGLPLSLLFNAGTLSDRFGFYIRGLVPFIYLLSFFVVRALPLTPRQAQQILNCVFAVGIAFAVITFAIYALTGLRGTWVYNPLTFPFPVLGAVVTFARMLMSRSRLAIFGWALLSGILGIATLLNFTKAQVIALIISLALVAFLIGRRRGHGTAARMLAFMVTIAICAAVLAIFVSGEGRGELSFSEMVVSRMNDDSSTDSRLSEWEASLSQFAESPLVGKGIGFQLEREMAPGEVVTAGYVHSQLAYIAMTMGIAGFIVYGMLLYNWAKLVVRFRQAAADLVIPLAITHGCVAALCVYALAFASFRTVQHNLLLGIFLALIVRMTPKLSAGSNHGFSGSVHDGELLG